MRRVPPRPRDALKIAHELHHLVLDADGFPAVGSRPGLEHLCSSLNSMLHDPLIGKALQRYGFDVWEDYNRQIAAAFDVFDAYPTAPSDEATRLRWIFNYVRLILVAVALTHAPARTQNEFHARFVEQYADLSVETEHVLALTEAIGYDAPEQQLRLFSAIIERYNLTQDLSLETTVAEF